MDLPSDSEPDPRRPWRNRARWVFLAHCGMNSSRSRFYEDSRPVVVLQSSIAVRIALFVLIACSLAEEPPQPPDGIDQAHQKSNAGDQVSDPAKSYTTKTTATQSYRTDRSSTSQSSEERAKGEGTVQTWTRAGTTEVESGATSNVKPPAARSLKSALEVDSTETTKNGVTTKVSATHSETITSETLSQSARPKNQPKSDQNTADLGKAKPPVPLLVGLYDHSYQVISTRPLEKIRFFAARIALPHVGDGTNTGEDVEGENAYTFFGRKAGQASCVAEWNNLCLSSAASSAANRWICSRKLCCLEFVALPVARCIGLPIVTMAS